MGCSICKVTKRSKVTDDQAKGDTNPHNKIATTESQDDYPLESGKKLLKGPRNEPKTNKNLDQVFAFSYTMTYMQNQRANPSSSSRMSSSKSILKSKRKKKKLLTLKERDDSSRYSGEEEVPSSSENEGCPDEDFDNFFEQNEQQNMPPNTHQLKEESFHSSSNQNSMSRNVNLKEKGTIENKNYSKLRKTDSIQTLNNAQFFRQRKVSVASIGISQKGGLSQTRVIKIGGESNSKPPVKVSYKERIRKRPRKSILSVNPGTKRAMMNTSGKKISDLIGRNMKKKRSGRSDFSNFKKMHMKGKKVETGKRRMNIGGGNMRGSGTFRKSMLQNYKKSAHQSEKRIILNSNQKIGSPKIRNSDTKNFHEPVLGRVQSLISQKDKNSSVEGKVMHNSAEKKFPGVLVNEKSLKSSSGSGGHMNTHGFEDPSPKSIFYPRNHIKNFEKYSLGSEKYKIPIPKVNVIKPHGESLIKLVEVQADKEVTPRNTDRDMENRKEVRLRQQVLENTPAFINMQYLQNFTNSQLINESTRSKNIRNQNNQLLSLCKELRVPQPRRKRKSISEVNEVPKARRTYRNLCRQSSEETISSDSTSRLEFRMQGDEDYDGRMSPARSNNPALARVRDNDSMGSQESAFSRNNVSIYCRNVADVTTLFDGTPTIKGYRIVQQIGFGSFAKVYKGRDDDTDKEFAIKVIDIKKVENISKWNNENFNIEDEIEIMKLLKHKNLIRLHKVVKDKKNICLVMDLHKRGTFCSKTFWYERKRMLGHKVLIKKLFPHEIQSYFKQLCEGIFQLHHTYNIAHRDLKMENLLVSDEGVLVISDFGISQQFEGKENDMTDKKIGTISIHPPELYLRKKFSGKACDIWAIGCILYYMVYQRYPNKSKNTEQLIEMIKKADIKYESDTEMGLRLLMEGILEKNPDKRLKIEEVLKMEWLNKEIPVINEY